MVRSTRQQVWPVFVFLAAGMMLFCSDALTGQEPAKTVRKLHKKYNISRDQAGVLLYDTRSGEALYAQNHQTPFIPASNMKILTAASAVGVLGREFQFRTEFYLEEQPTKSRDNGVHPKTLFVRGTGDPNISGRFHGGNTLALLEKWAKKLQKAGVTELGDIVLDDTLYDRNWRHPTWEDEDLPYWYAAPVGAFILNDNCVDLVVRPGKKPGRPTKVEMDPPFSSVIIQNKSRTVAKRKKGWIKFQRKKGTRNITIRGQFPVNGGARKEPITVLNPSVNFGVVLKHKLEEEGVSVNGSIHIREMSASIKRKQPRFVYRTDLDRSLKVFLKKSQNLYSETVFKRIGAARYGKGTWENGSKGIMQFLQAKGLAKRGCRVIDGSGLSRKNLLTPRTIVEVLRWFYRDDFRRRYLRMLPVAGKDGTLENRMDRAPYRGNIFAKTGYMSGVISLSGLVAQNGLDGGNEDQSGTVFFSVLLNGEGITPAQGRKFCDEIGQLAHRLMKSRKNTVK